MAFVIGLTGGIGCGKSTAAKIFGEFGVPVVDADEISHRLTAANGRAIAAVRDHFGPASLLADGALDRARMRKLIFMDATARLRLQNILHPLIQAEAATLIEQAVSPYIILVVPLLVETGACGALVQRVLAIDCAEATQIARVAQRAGGLEEQEVRAIMAVQANRQMRLKHADDVVPNEKDITALRAQLARLHFQYLELARTPGPCIEPQR